MKTRLAVPEDYPALDTLLGNNVGRDVRLARDVIVVQGEFGKPTGALIGRPAFLVHELVLDEHRPFGMRDVFALVDFGKRTGVKMGLQEAVFVVREDNAKMHRFMPFLGARAEEPGRIYTLAL